MAKAYHCSRSPWPDSPLHAATGGCFPPCTPHSCRPASNPCRGCPWLIFSLFGADRCAPVGYGPPLPDTIGFWAAAGGRHSILNFGAGARERHKLPRFAACVGCRIGFSAGRARAGIPHWRILDNDADRWHSEWMRAASYSNRGCKWNPGHLRQRGQPGPVRGQFRPIGPTGSGFLRYTQPLGCPGGRQP